MTDEKICRAVVRMGKRALYLSLSDDLVREFGSIVSMPVLSVAEEDDDVQQTTQRRAQRQAARAGSGASDSGMGPGSINTGG